jgi:Protein of unknown function (DUF4238)
MNAPRNHHFIPAFFLKQWTGPDGKLVEYSIKHHKLIPKPVGPDATGYEFDLYAFSEFPSDQAQFIEQTFFNYADRTASDALQLNLSNADASAWTVEQKSAWSRFIIALHLRHPDTMPELRAAAQSVWEGTAEASQRQYELIKKPEDPPTFDEYLAARDPLTHTKARVNLILKSFDNEILGKHINNMTWAIVDLSPATNHLLISDRPVTFSNLKEKNGYASIAISPTKLFVAVNSATTLDFFRRTNQETIVRAANKDVVTRSRKYVWSQNESQTRFLQNNMSKKMEPTPLLPNIGWKS